MDIISVSNWTVIFFWYLLAVIPQLLIILSSLAWTRLLSVTYLFPELILASMTSNFTFGPVQGKRKGKLVLQDGLTWVMVTTSISGLIVSGVILEMAYRGEASVTLKTVANFWLYGSHGHLGPTKLTIPPIFPLAAAFVSACLTALVLNMERWWPRQRTSLLSMKRSVYTGRTEDEHRDKQFKMTCTEQRLI